METEAAELADCKPDVSTTGPARPAGRGGCVGLIFDRRWRMKKHKRDGASSMESARSAAGSWCSQSRPQIGFIGSMERLWNKTLKVNPDTEDALF